MGMHFGNLGVKVRGQITYTLSPFEQRAFAGFFKEGFHNMVRRFGGQVLRVSPPFVIAYLIYDWGEKENLRLSRLEAKGIEV